MISTILAVAGTVASVASVVVPLGLSVYGLVRNEQMYSESRAENAKYYSENSKVMNLQNSQDYINKYVIKSDSAARNSRFSSYGSTYGKENV